jgi:transcriptional regulator with XRE-family HTH domain
MTLDRKRLEAAMAKVDLVGDRALARRLGVGHTRPGDWCRKKLPNGENLINLCRALKVSPFHLLGEDAAEARRRLAEDADLSLGAAEGEILRAMGKLSEQARGQLLERASTLAEQSRAITTAHPSDTDRRPADYNPAIAPEETRTRSHDTAKTPVSVPKVAVSSSNRPARPKKGRSG